MRPAHIRNTCILVCAVLSVAACSTTRRLGSDEVLYTGVKKIRIEPDSGVVLSAAAESAVKEPLSVAPNNPLYSPYICRSGCGPTTTSTRPGKRDSNTGYSNGWPNSPC